MSAIPSVLGSQAQKFCALTFDDGPDERFTMQIMEILDAYGIKATFFIVGKQAESFPDQVVALHNSGHEIANHSYSHPDFAKLSSANRRSEIAQLNSLLENLGITPKWFRPPYGAYNKATVNIAANHGLETVLWTLDPKDWDTPGVDVIQQRVLTQAKNGGVILLHSTNAQTVAALPGIIDGLRAQGFQFVSMRMWRDIVTGNKGLLNIKPPHNSPYPVAFAKEQEAAMSVFSQTSKFAQLCLPEPIRRTDLSGSAVSQTLIVYSNFKNQAECSKVQITGKGNPVASFVSSAPKQEPVDSSADDFPHSVESTLSRYNLYYHMGNGGNPDPHDSPEWPRPTAQPDV